MANPIRMSHPTTSNVSTMSPTITGTPSHTKEGSADGAIHPHMRGQEMLELTLVCDLICQIPGVKIGR
jgi:hypothetical protein